jgi:hypothetical protein
MWGIVPAAGLGGRAAPLAYSKELVPVGTRRDGAVDRPRAVSEHVVERMLLAGATRLCFVIPSGRHDVLDYWSGGFGAWGGALGEASPCFVVQPRPAGLCDALFRALPLIGAEEQVLVGLPHTVWLPEEGFRRLRAGGLSFLCFPVDRPELGESVLASDDGDVREIRVRAPDPGAGWVWGGFKLDGAVLRELFDLWCARGREDAHVGTLVTAWIAQGGQARAVRAGEAYADVFLPGGFAEATRLCAARGSGR